MTEFLEGNRELWDEWTGIHESSDLYRLEEFHAGGIRLRDHELEQVGDVRGKTLLHLQCHFGIEGAFDVVYTSRGVLGWLPTSGGGRASSRTS